MQFIFEHVAYNYRNVDEVVDWYVANLGLKILKRAGSAAFLGDADGRVFLEVYTNETVPFLNDSAPAPLSLHTAFVVDDAAAARDHLLTAGAKLAEDVRTTPAGDTLCMLTDPWGIGLQVLQRRQSMLD
jgi:catechol 2,3-dioxygenase-like lactoylglutathione lyase family enzyme